MHVMSIYSALSLIRRQARDLRKIDSRVPNLIPTILVRREAVLVGFVSFHRKHIHILTSARLTYYI